jgi:hypothetical protein
MTLSGVEKATFKLTAQYRKQTGHRLVVSFSETAKYFDIG